MTQRVRDMVAAATRAHQTNDPSDNENKRFRTFIFLFANTFLHEIGHTLVTFLTKGQACTPRHIRATTRGYSGEDRGEAGRNLETVIFGGTMEYYRDRADDDSQVCPRHCALINATDQSMTYKLTYTLARRPPYPHQRRRSPNLTRIDR